jgi:hypothetical protein
MGANDVHGAIRQMTLPAGYKTSVNESETITDAQAIEWRFGEHIGAAGFRSGSDGGIALMVPAVRNIERS